MTISKAGASTLNFHTERLQPQVKEKSADLIEAQELKETPAFNEDKYEPAATKSERSMASAGSTGLDPRIMGTDADGRPVYG